MSSRRNFLKNTSMLFLASAVPSAKVIAGTDDGDVQTTATTEGTLPFKQTYVRNVFVTENEFRGARPAIIESPGYKGARDILPSPFWSGNKTAIDMYWKTRENEQIIVNVCTSHVSIENARMNRP